MASIVDFLMNQSNKAGKGNFCNQSVGTCTSGGSFLGHLKRLRIFQ